MRLMGVEGSSRSQIGDCGDGSKIRESIENEGSRAAWCIQMTAQSSWQIFKIDYLYT
ncbi:uncharacterized protein Dsimw501_GD29093, isoform A [Drosophila simulans]|uniref:Uncharacterized protein, isoform A n=1 Tax=Drosophila simulans TaxID=7240 RepID=A0A0J9REK8_DROSI|nr:uncharacterized protein Dsimw501_GD29093, isoform A [Drosophila simulans]